MARPIRVLLAKLGLDAHTIGINVIAQAMRDAGMEVIYSGLRQTPEMVVNAAIQEGVDVVGMSSLSAAHMRHFPEVVRQLREKGADDILVIGGGVIPEEDEAELLAAGLDQIFTMGTDTREIVRYLQERMREREEVS
ncbi:MAG: methylmalonyl-CoA mutase [Spirochaeta sp.]|jgi:methylmalonyl-CoA mutase C-terminal domain/subunit|nr:methylmalonyl-CoA mutase [Spirochaeta sp.]RPG08532.1 MAG: cobalamin B12-binding domain-containing protein [Proteobacteria bacterium TMED72]